MTGFSPAVLGTIGGRSGGVCEVCGANRATQKHHRRPRRAGGSKRDDTNLAANGLDACNYCHDVIEKNRALAYLVGWLLSDNQLPDQERVLRRGEYVLLDNDGDIQPDTNSFATQFI
ncbi:hypothetical protein ORI20_13830 [Mycobacterium sp. CVI_P3]|uniref:HNH endonuclease n=1 Tax=Mycobacterium pinniadriaticum TaxID=2994102 RepID=A0ABT3SF65_9MYCO|nr:hypothetical protein [Mycobacterium pinniadriaticum]MCX2931359.1 hypothetical protein [Mycobacterium pinniadriaticum]MCX2937783.1 hypothetical protein [Mycobacterium pinniadriaticum]